MTLAEFRALAERAIRVEREGAAEKRDGWALTDFHRAASPTAVIALIDRLERAEKCLRTIADAPAWGAPDRWETTPGECRRFAAAYFNAPAGEGER